MENFVGLVFVLKEIQYKWDVVFFCRYRVSMYNKDSGYSFILLMFNHKLGKLR